MGNLHSDFGIRRDAEGQFRIANAIIDIDQNSNVFVQGNRIREPGGYLNH
jgi:hypothetical protein